ncbi:MAG: hypothetical protein HY930_00515 [Euryarchaeota archaeon]|nr:hypothetical protein [Euryarchaeota archaeon]
MENIFSKLDSEILVNLEKKKISEELIKYCRESKEELTRLEDKVMQKDDILDGLKLFSSCDTCISILEKVTPELEKAKEVGENPISLERIYDILLAVVAIGDRISEIFNGEGAASFNVKQIREYSLSLQEEAEKRGLIEPLSDKIRRIPKELRKSIAEKALALNS